MSIVATVAHFSYCWAFVLDGYRPPSWICDERVWTSHKGYLVVFITVQNLVKIDAT